ncbi:MAG: extracellular solute-binding protein [Candidatus Ancillula sp.]|jgi:phosphate transport system substrate-binding protein|nr:extracellular solute-binding protein [Candidatus Ancillula sp.]
MNMKINIQFAKAFAVLAVFATAISLASCGSNAAQNGSSPISIITREDGSGTRSAFIELFKVQDSDKVDHTIDQASVNNSTAVVMTSVQSDKNAIGYISLGSLNNSVKAVQIDGVEPTVPNIISGSYTIARPFNIATKSDISDATNEFMAYLSSSQAASVIDGAGYISEPSTEEYIPAEGVSGKVKIGGSSSVSPLMEKLVEDFESINPDVQIEVQTSDSSTGINGAIDGTFDIAMASRELKASEEDKGLTATTIATDGLVVVVNQENSIDSLTIDQVNKIYTGDITDWSELTSN